MVLKFNLLKSLLFKNFVLIILLITCHYTFAQWTGGTTDPVAIYRSGNVGIGNTNPLTKLHINGTFRVTGKSLSYGYYNICATLFVGNTKVYDGMAKCLTTDNPSQYTNYRWEIPGGYVYSSALASGPGSACGAPIDKPNVDLDLLDISNSNTTLNNIVNINNRLNVLGVSVFKDKVSIGTKINTNSDALLSVFGTLYTTKTVLTQLKWADFVFEKDHQLLSLQETENFIESNKHLPGIPSEKEIIEKGLDAGEMLKLQMEKIEELTLHLIAQQKKIEALEKMLSK